jgi:DNA-binding NarL/FixJ family response regulator
MPPIRLLIADDNAEFRRSVELLVSTESDIEVVSLAGDGQEALERAQQLKPDAVLIDVHMPRIDGLAAIRALALESPGTICMAMSYDSEHEALRQAMAAGAREYLVKPFEPDELVHALRRLVPRRATSPLAPGRAADAAETAARQRQAEAIRTAVEYLRTGRADPEATRVYDELVRLPGLDASTLTRLAEIFLARRDWRTLRLLAERLERLSKSPGARQ